MSKELVGNIIQVDKLIEEDIPVLTQPYFLGLKSEAERFSKEGIGRSTGSGLKKANLKFERNNREYRWELIYTESEPVLPLRFRQRSQWSDPPRTMGDDRRNVDISFHEGSIKSLSVARENYDEKVEITLEDEPRIRWSHLRLSERDSSRLGGSMDYFYGGCSSLFMGTLLVMYSCSLKDHLQDSNAAVPAAVSLGAGLGLYGLAAYVFHRLWVKDDLHLSYELDRNTAKFVTQISDRQRRFIKRHFVSIEESLDISDFKDLLSAQLEEIPIVSQEDLGYIGFNRFSRGKRGLF